MKQATMKCELKPSEILEILKKHFKETPQEPGVGIYEFQDLKVTCKGQDIVEMEAGEEIFGEPTDSKVQTWRRWLHAFSECKMVVVKNFNGQKVNYQL